MPNGGHPMHLEIHLDDDDHVVYVSEGITIWHKVGDGPDDYIATTLTDDQVDAVRQQLDHWCRRPVPARLVTGDGVRWAM